IQLTNKQLVFYFMAGATGLILSFLAGVMVGRGVDNATPEVQAAAAQPLKEDRIVTEEAPPGRPARPRPSGDDLTYAQRLEGDKADDTLEKPGASPKAATAAAPALVQASPRVVPAPGRVAAAGTPPKPPAAIASPAAAPPTLAPAKPSP